MKKELFLSLIIILSGCRATNQTLENPDTTNVKSISSTSKETDLIKENQKLNLEIQKLQDTIKDYDNSLKQIENNDPLKQTEEKTPEIKNFTSTQSWKSISITSGQHTVTVTDKEILEAASDLFLITRVAHDLPNGPENNIDNFTLILENSKGTSTLYVVSRDVIIFPDLAPGKYFNVSSNVYNFGKALMSKPDYIPIESTESRMLNSGMMYVIEGNYHYYTTSESRVRGVSEIFLRASKNTIAKPSIIPSFTIEDLTFYLYGKQIHMKVYPKLIQITDSSRENWYQVDETVIQQIHAKISGS